MKLTLPRMAARRISLAPSGRFHISLRRARESGNIGQRASTVVSLSLPANDSSNLHDMTTLTMKMSKNIAAGFFIWTSKETRNVGAQVFGFLACEKIPQISNLVSLALVSTVTQSLPWERGVPPAKRRNRRRMCFSGKLAGGTPALPGKSLRVISPRFLWRST